MFLSGRSITELAIGVFTHHPYVAPLHWLGAAHKKQRKLSSRLYFINTFLLLILNRHPICDQY